MSPRVEAWLGAAVAMLRGGDLEGAEAALAEANILDASNPKVWGYLCVVALLAERVDEAEAALGSAFKTDLRDARLLAEVGTLFLERGRWRHAEGALRRAVKRGAGADARFALGRAMIERGDADGAKAEWKYAAAIAAEANERDVRAQILDALAELYEELGEEHMAVQCRRELDEVVGGARARNGEGRDSSVSAHPRETAENHRRDQYNSSQNLESSCLRAWLRNAHFLDWFARVVSVIVFSARVFSLMDGRCGRAPVTMRLGKRMNHSPPSSARRLVSHSSAARRHFIARAARFV